MTTRQRTIVLAIAFIILCAAMLAAGVMATRFVQGTGKVGDGFLLAVFVLLAIAALITITMTA